MEFKQHEKGNAYHLLLSKQPKLSLELEGWGPENNAVAGTSLSSSGRYRCKRGLAELLNDKHTWM